MVNEYLDDKEKICMFCKKEIICDKEEYYHIEYYDKGCLKLKKWAHVSCREKIAEMKAMQRIQNNMEKMFPQAAKIIGGMLKT